VGPSIASQCDRLVDIITIIEIRERGGSWARARVAAGGLRKLQVCGLASSCSSVGRKAETDRAPDSHGITTAMAAPHWPCERGCEQRSEPAVQDCPSRLNLDRCADRSHRSQLLLRVNAKEENPPSRTERPVRPVEQTGSCEDFDILPALGGQGFPGARRQPPAWVVRGSPARATPGLPAQQRPVRPPRCS
jgi:hypothetical protein